MKRRTRIDLVNQREYAFHGCLPEEALIGSDYLINVRAWADVTDSASTDALGDTVDYVALRRIVGEEMAVRANLLETVLERMARRVFAEHPSVERVKISLAKLNPPLDGDVQAVRVVWDVRR
ncbi:MAG: dihydroneopterin aldolase [Bacteroidota bacterium]|jgi:dihydroneopterin aldolase